LIEALAMEANLSTNKVDLNYRAPSTPLSEDFIAYEPIRRGLIDTVAGSLCWFFASLIVVAFAINISTLFAMTTKIEWLNLGESKSGRIIIVLLLASFVQLPIFTIAGYSFFQRRRRRGLILSLLAFGLGSLMTCLTEMK
jgi:hypothetical protein